MANISKNNKFQSNYNSLPSEFRKNSNLRIANGPGMTNGVSSNISVKEQPKVDPKDPQVRKLVYNMYRGLLDKKHDQANTFLETVPKSRVEEDFGVGHRVQSMMRQQVGVTEGKPPTGGLPPPPPPPPPPVPGLIPQTALANDQMAGIQNQGCPPLALAGAMMKDKKPFTYTPGGLDLSEISSNQGPQQAKKNGINGITGEVAGAPVQSRSFRVLQNVLDTHESSETVNPSSGAPMKIQVPLGPPPNAKPTTNQVTPTYKDTSYHQNISKPPFLYNSGPSSPVGNKITQNNPISQNLTNLIKQQVRIAENIDDIRTRGGHIRSYSSSSSISEPEGPVHIPRVHSSSSPPPSDRMRRHLPPPHQDGVDPTEPLEEFAAPEPKKYMGGNIPSRTFKMLQAMTDDPDDVAGPGQTDL